MESMIDTSNSFTQTKHQVILSDRYAVTREKNNRSFYHFIEHFWPVVSNDTFKSNWHIKDVLCDELEQLVYRVSKGLPRKYDLIFNVPPGTTKTITCSIMFPAWCWSLWYWMRFICGSYSAALSLESAEYCRDLIRSEAFRKIYPELGIKEDKDTKSNFKVYKRIPKYQGRMDRIAFGGNRYSTSVGGTLMGFHGHILIIDDPLNPTQAASEKELENANQWMTQTLPTRKTDKAVTPTVLVMQRLHQDDPTGHLLSKKKKNIRHISLPGEIRNFREHVQPTELIKYYKDDLLDPVRLNWKMLDDLEADLGQYGYAGQIGQNPTSPGGGMFKVDHFQMLSRMPPLTNIIASVRYWDKAGSQGTGAFTVGVKMHKFADGHFLIEDVIRGQWSSEEREMILKQTARSDGYNVTVGIEQEPGSGGKESAEATIRNLAGYSCFKECPTGDKVFRADPFSVQVNNGNVQMLVADWNHVYKDELRNFPFSTYKDQADASSGAFKKLADKRVARRVI